MSNEISNANGPCRCHPIATLEYSHARYSFGRHAQTDFWKHEFWYLGDLDSSIREWAKSNYEFECNSAKHGSFFTPIKVTWIDWDAPAGESWHEERVEHFVDVRAIVTRVFNRENKAKVFHKF